MVVSGPFVVTRARSPVGVPRRSVVALAVWRVFVVPRWSVVALAVWRVFVVPRRSVVALRGWRAVVVPHWSVGHAAALRFGHLNVTLLVVQATVGTESLSDMQSLDEVSVEVVPHRRVGAPAAVPFQHLNVTPLVVHETVGTGSLSDVQSLHEARVGMVRPRCERLRDRKVGLDGDHGSGA
ncbi:hypothetical protein [Ornithinimicrobium sp. CNJ-824]|uniref:hypothetical protein n=1 Tax=Ornithinimicrobium sp. CNJ-824 TaxID=1904966 RepID=UPI00117C976F|nr:hypothetical protein [Ornithinimicrobium sp. CNJ-824]